MRWDSLPYLLLTLAVLMLLLMIHIQMSLHAEPSGKEQMLIFSSKSKANKEQPEEQRQRQQPVITVDVHSYSAPNTSSPTPQPTGAPVSVEDTEDQSRWLVISIPTVARRNNEDYLLQSLAEIVKQLPTDPRNVFYRKILILVVNTMPKNLVHVRYREAKEKYAHLIGVYLEFIDLAELIDRNRNTHLHLKDPFPGRRDRGTSNIPGYRVRQQSRDIAVSMFLAKGKAKYYMVLEDDMKFCPEEFTVIRHLLMKAEAYHPNWMGIRASYGMNGVFLHDADVDVFANYLVKHQARRPPDHLITEWCAGETEEAKSHKLGSQDQVGSRKNVGFRYNLFHHLGVSSTLRSQKQDGFPICYEQLVSPVVFEVEAYNPELCPDEDIWPCNVDYKQISNVWKGPKVIDFRALGIDVDIEGANSIVNEKRRDVVLTSRAS